MKRFSIFVLVIMLALSLAACGKKNNNNTTAPSSTTPTAGSSILPETEPTMGTNIPDDNVNDNSTGNAADSMDGTTVPTNDNSTNADNSTSGMRSRSNTAD